MKFFFTFGHIQLEPRVPFQRQQVRYAMDRNGF